MQPTVFFVKSALFMAQWQGGFTANLYAGMRDTYLKVSCSILSLLFLTACSLYCLWENVGNIQKGFDFMASCRLVFRLLRGLTLLSVLYAQASEPCIQDQVSLLDLPIHIIQEEVCRHISQRDMAHMRMCCRALRHIWNHSIPIKIDVSAVVKPDIKDRILCGNGLSDIPLNKDKIAAFMKIFVDHMAVCRNPIILNLSGCSLYASIESFVPGFFELVHMKDLCLDDTFVRYEDIVKICYRMPALETLCLARNELYDVPYVLDKLRDLKRLYIGSNHFNKEVFARVCATMRSLHSLDVRFNDLQEMPPQIREMKNLRSLFLVGNSFTLQAIKNICSWLPQLRILDLSCNQLYEVPDEIRSLRNLKRLVLLGNRITTEAINRFCSDPSSLQELNLQFNRITTVPEQIKNFRNLRLLNVSSNSLIRSDIQLLKELLPGTRIIV